MKIGILAFGSLVWDSGDLNLEKDKDGKVIWLDGPNMPIEFCRISKNGRLTLAIDEACGCKNTSFYSISQDSLENTVRKLQKREKISDEFLNKSISVVHPFAHRANEGARKYSKEFLDYLAAWGCIESLDCIVFSSLQRRFKDVTGHPFTPQHAINYLFNLEKHAQKGALDYINRNSRIKSPVMDLFMASK